MPERARQLISLGGTRTSIPVALVRIGFTGLSGNPSNRLCGLWAKRKSALQLAVFDVPCSQLVLSSVLGAAVEVAEHLLDRACTMARGARLRGSHSRFTTRMPRP